MSYPALSFQLRSNRTAVNLLTQMGAGVVLLFLVVLVSLQLAPTVTDQGRDSGIFAYTGRVIEQGGLPYRDAWDNKPPGVYYIDALAFVLFGPTRWALWLIETISVFLTGWLLFWLLSQLYDEGYLPWAGTLILVLLTRHPILVEDTNFTEVYALLPQMVCYVAGYLFLRNPRHRWGFLIGFSVGIAFLIKQTTVGVAVMFVPALLISRHPVIRSPRRWTWLGGIITGGLASLGVVTLWLLWHGVLLDAIYATFISPMQFHNWVSQEPVTLWDRVVLTFTGSAAPIVVGPLLPFIWMGVRATLRNMRYLRHHETSERLTVTTTITIWAAMTLSFDLFLTNVTNRGYGHYYVTLLPALALVMTPAIAVLTNQSRQTDKTRYRRTMLRILWVALLLAVAGGAMVGTLYRFYEVDWQVTGPARLDEVATYVLQHTQPEDTVLVWGAWTAINFQADRFSPTQYHYGYPLIVPTEEQTELEQVEEIVTDLSTNQPVLIVDRTLEDGLRIPPLDPVRRQAWWAEGGRRDTTDLTMVYEFVAEHCAFETAIEDVYIYRCTY